jgi:hypothetical protein
LKSPLFQAVSQTCCLLKFRLLSCKMFVLTILVSIVLLSFYQQFEVTGWHCHYYLTILMRHSVHLFSWLRLLMDWGKKHPQILAINKWPQYRSALFFTLELKHFRNKDRVPFPRKFLSGCTFPITIKALLLLLLLLYYVYGIYC